MIFSTIVLLTSSMIAIQPKQQYVINSIEVEWNVTTTNNLKMEWEITRPQRGVSALTGVLDIKAEVNTDKSFISVNIYYSPNGISYTRSPFHYPSSTMTAAFNSVYKNYFMKPVKNCCENGIEFEGEFVSPLIERRMICRNCLLNPDDLPSHLRVGFYKIEIVGKGEMEFVLQELLRVELD